MLKYLAGALVLLLAAQSPAAAQSSEIDALREKAEAGDIEATLSLGLKLADGDGVPEDDVAALELFRAAADAGDARGSSFWVPCTTTEKARRKTIPKPHGITDAPPSKVI